MADEIKPNELDEKLDLLCDKTLQAFIPVLERFRDESWAVKTPLQGYETLEMFLRSMRHIEEQYIADKDDLAELLRLPGSIGSVSSQLDLAKTEWDIAYRNLQLTSEALTVASKNSKAAIAENITVTEKYWELVGQFLNALRAAGLHLRVSDGLDELILTGPQASRHLFRETIRNNKWNLINRLCFRPGRSSDDAEGEPL